MDGEVIIGPVNHPNAMQHTSSALNSFHGDISKLNFLLFDNHQHPQMPFMERHAQMQELNKLLKPDFPWLQIVEHKLIYNLADFLAYEDVIVKLGLEGIMGRDPNAPYKFGRATMREQILMALKRFVDDDALVLEYLEEVENTNVATINALGHTERSGHQANLIPKGSMGSMLCASAKFDDLFNVGGGRGITAALRQEVWDHPERFQWRVMKYVYQDIGIRTRPRLPRFHSWRPWADLDPATIRALLAKADTHIKKFPDSISALLPQFKPEMLGA
jgi:ATP-dependent DNA ligase